MSDDARYAALVARDTRFDGVFFVGVTTTGVYCRPMCPSRRPGREQVIFFATPDAAEQAGLRPCKRCQPQASHAPQVDVVQRVRRYIETHVGETITLDDLSREVDLSPYHLQRTFKRFMGVTPKQYAITLRLQRLKAELKNGQPVAAAQYEAGYGSSSRLYEQASGQLGMTPLTYQQGGAGVDIRYSIVDSALGRLLIAVTERGVCMVSMGDDDVHLLSALAEEYPEATVTQVDDLRNAWVQAIMGYLGSCNGALDVPVDVTGTAFQRRVWEALRAIPFGSTRTYNEIAASLGNAKAARAVGHACATNPVALIIPCHRAVRAGGGLGGYRWGLERKRKLLEQEKSRSHYGDMPQEPLFG
jgi:AraC family transcriptional regulator of adaptative response/methylated-DNA-[protein]-cysteine methyltransferase